MAARDYPRLNWEPFCDNLFQTLDLDPMYVALHNTWMPQQRLKRWLLAYWCFYHGGVASVIAESNDFYGKGQELYKSAPRGFERRHFRGDKGLNAWRWLERQGKPEDLVDSITKPTFLETSQAVQEWPMFGPWIAWKVGDMLERVLNCDIDFSGASLYIYNEPVKGAALIRFGDYEHPIKKEELQDTVDMMLKAYAGVFAPPRLNRFVNIQEIETCLCKYKAHYKGFYPLGNDTHELRKGLAGWGDLAQELMKNLPGEHSATDS